MQQVGHPGDVYRNPANPFVATFLGAANLLEGRVLDANSVEAYEAVIPVATSLPYGTPVEIAIRAEGIVPSKSPGWNGCLSGCVELVRDIGSASEVVVGIREGTEVRCRVAGAATSEFRVGDKVGLAIDPQALSLFAAGMPARIRGTEG